MGKVSLWSCKGIIVSLEQPVGLYVMEPENGVKVRVDSVKFLLSSSEDFMACTLLLHSYLSLKTPSFFSFLHIFCSFVFFCCIVCIFVDAFFKFSINVQY